MFHWIFQSLKVELSVDPEALMCSTVIHVNDTHTMRGQQEIEVVPHQPQTINFGLMPPNVDPQIPMTHAGFQVSSACIVSQVCLATNSILFCWLSTIKERCKNVRLQQNAQSRFVRVAFDSVLGPPRLAQHHLTESLFLCSSRNNAPCESRALEGCHVSSKSPSRVWDRDEGVAGRNYKESRIIILGSVANGPNYSAE